MAAKIIGVTGAQGGGKSTLLRALADKNYHVDSFKVSRAVQEAMNFKTLKEATSDFKTMVKYQYEVLNQKMKREEQLLVEHSGIILTERTFADIAVYTQMWTWDLITTGDVELKTGVDFLTKFSKICSDYQQVYAGVLILPSMPHIAWEEDKNRAEQSKIEMFEETLSSFMRLMQTSNVPTFTITAKTVLERVEDAELFFRRI